MAELNRVRKAHGLPPERAYVRYYAPQDKDISKMKRFGGTPDER
jgi:hypothetical protein